MGNNLKKRKREDGLYGCIAVPKSKKVCFECKLDKTGPKSAVLAPPRDDNEDGEKIGNRIMSPKEHFSVVEDLPGEQFDYIDDEGDPVLLCGKELLTDPFLLNTTSTVPPKTNGDPTPSDPRSSEITLDLPLQKTNAEVRIYPALIPREKPKKVAKFAPARFYDRYNIKLHRVWVR